LWIKSPSVASRPQKASAAVDLRDAPGRPDDREVEDRGADAAGGNLLTFMISELDRAADQKRDEESE